MKVTELQKLLENIISSKYYSHDEAKTICEVLLYAELSGKNTQGALKLLGTEPIQDIKPQHKSRVIKETNVSALIDGGGNPGILVAQFATDKAIALASNSGMSMVAVNNTFSSTGAVGFYVSKIARHDLIGIVATNSPRAISHYGTTAPAYGTNPIAFGFPTEDKPIVFDMASSAITWYGLVRAKALGQPLPDNVAIDSNGNVTTDPDAAMAGAILPFDRSYKGSGLAMVVELLAGVLSGASYVFDTGDWGTTFITLSPEILIGTGEFKRRSTELINRLKSLSTKDSTQAHIPGYDLEERMHLKNGDVEIEDKLLDELRACTSEIQH
jgi:LDH2 family malate/lactate/ureidoglycolate dehydrogenase